MRKTPTVWARYQATLWILVALVMFTSPTFASPERICSKATLVDVGQRLDLPHRPYSEPPPPTTGDPDRDPTWTLADQTKTGAPISPGGGVPSLILNQAGMLELVQAGILIALGPGEYPIVAPPGANLDERLRLYEICDGIYDAQHDGCHCTDPIEHGNLTAGEPHGPVDVDVFALTPPQRQTVLLETVGSMEPCELFEGIGAPLVLHDHRVDCRDLQVVATLPGGRYLLRVTGSGALQGRYAFLASAVGSQEVRILHP